MLQSKSFYSLTPGPRLLVLGAVHGNEKCGTQAIERVMGEISAGQIELQKGSVTFVPICNPKAYEADERFSERNLNRFLIPQDNPDCYEAYLGNILCPLLESCDYLLDLHSYHQGKGSYVYVGKPGTDEHLYANSLGALKGITGWAQAYAASGTEKKQTDPHEPIGTTEYARRFGALAATLECGQHKDPASVEAGYRAIRGALAFLEMSAMPVALEAPTHTQLVTLQRVFYRDAEAGGHFIKEWGELDKVRKGETIAIRANGEELCAPSDGFIILPNTHAEPEAEWFYFGHSEPSDKTPTLEGGKTLPHRSGLAAGL